VQGLGVFGKGTVTLEFTAALPVDFTSSKIRVKTVMEYRGLDYLVKHSTTITSSRIS